MTYSQSSYTMTHIPTGETITSTNSRSMLKNKQMCEKVLRSRLWAINNGFPRPDLNTIVADYEFPDTNQYPYDIMDYRK